MSLSFTHMLSDDVMNRMAGFCFVEWGGIVICDLGWRIRIKHSVMTGVELLMHSYSAFNTVQVIGRITLIK